MTDTLKQAILGLSKSSDWILVRSYLLEGIKNILLEPSDSSLSAEDYKIDRLGKEKAYEMLNDLLNNLEFKEPRKFNNSNMR